MKNVGKSEAGAITAALFLQEFVPAKTAWSHWDIAGTAFTTAPWKYFKPGGTGWGLKSLVETARLLAG
jgi:leucyl aminopeptidase